MEKITLSAPISDFQIARLMLDWEGASIMVVIHSGDNFLQFRYEGPIATQLMTALNKTDLSVKSLHRRIIERLLADGMLTGTISGTPD